MHHFMRAMTAVVVLLGGLLAAGAPAPARAAQSYDNCTGFIDSLPATISTQGTWCLRKDLGTAMTSGNAITINTNNVTIDCNDFKLGGQAAGAGTTAVGIAASNRINATVRHCNIRGFYIGVYFTGASGGGHVVEDNRFDGNTYVGIYVEGDGSVVRRNHVRDTGGSTVDAGSAYAISTIYNTDVLDNSVDGVLPSADSSGNGYSVGIDTYLNTSGRINGNGVRGLVHLGAGFAYGIHSFDSSRLHLRDNDLSGDGGAGIGLSCTNGDGHARDNTVTGFSTPISGCSNDLDNVLVP